MMPVSLNNPGAKSMTGRVPCEFAVSTIAGLRIIFCSGVGLPASEKTNGRSPVHAPSKSLRRGLCACRAWRACRSSHVVMGGEQAIKNAATGFWRKKSDDY
jgi:hypothetical protein